MEIQCPACGSFLSESEIDFDRSVGTCSHCQAFLNLDAKLSNSPKRENRSLSEIPLPEGMTFRDFLTRIEIERKWFSFSYLFLVFFCLFWDGMIIFMYVAMFSSPDISWIAILFPLLHVITGVCLTYFTVCGLFNKTLIKCQTGELSVKHAPFPWPGSKVYPAHFVKQLFVRRNAHPQKNQGVMYSYDVVVRTSDKTINLLRNLQSSDQALFIEQKLEAFLKIEDIPVRGETPR